MLKKFTGCCGGTGGTRGGWKGAKSEVPGEREAGKKYTKGRAAGERDSSKSASTNEKR